MSDSISAMKSQYDYYKRLCLKFHESPKSGGIMGNWTEHFDELEDREIDEANRRMPKPNQNNIGPLYDDMRRLLQDAWMKGFEAGKTEGRKNRGGKCDLPKAGQLGNGAYFTKARGHRVYMVIEPNYFIEDPDPDTVYAVANNGSTTKLAKTAEVLLATKDDFHHGWTAKK